MPITQSTPITFVLTSINLDMVAGKMVCGFTRTISGMSDTNTVITIQGSDFVNLLATQATAGQALSDEITEAIYTYVTTTQTAGNQIAGTVS